MFWHSGGNSEKRSRWVVHKTYQNYQYSVSVGVHVWQKETLIQYHCLVGKWWLAQPLWKTTWTLARNLRLELQMNQKFHSVYLPQNQKILLGKNICTPIFIVALFVVAHIWKQPKIHNKILLRFKKKIKSCNLLLQMDDGWNWKVKSARRKWTDTE